MNLYFATLTKLLLSSFMRKFALVGQKILFLLSFFNFSLFPPFFSLFFSSPFRLLYFLLLESQSDGLPSLTNRDFHGSVGIPLSYTNEDPTRAHNPIACSLLVGWSVCWSLLAFFGRFVHHCPCLNLWQAYFITSPAHPHATWVAVYPALFLKIWMNCCTCHM